MLDALETCLARALLASAVGALGHQCGVDAVEEEEARKNTESMKRAVWKKSKQRDRAKLSTIC